MRPLTARERGRERRGAESAGPSSGAAVRAAAGVLATATRIGSVASTPPTEFCLPAGSGRHTMPPSKNLQEAPMRVIGTVVEAESGKPLQGLRVRAYDKDLIFDDKLGDTLTDATGKFEISYTEAHFRDLEETEPDLYIRIYDGSGKKLLYTSEKAVRRNAQITETFDVKISKAKLA
jgi:hypothetical protein